MNIHPFSLSLLSWFHANGRSLPWRQTRDPYAIWLSEVILQQTRIEQGLPYWERFMERWPRVEQLAAATEDEVLRMWQGLGYYSRARNLHAAARQIVAMGAFPQTLDGIKSLKGVGDYTAAAIASMAYGIPVAVVDGNVYRVLSRHFGIATPINTAEGKHEFAALAQALLPKGEASAYNQAVMDFGAVLCTPQQPRCMECPIMETCVALRSGRTHELPVKLKTLKVRERKLVYLYIRCNGYVAIHRRGGGDIWQGLWEPVLLDTTAIVTDENGVCVLEKCEHRQLEYQYNESSSLPVSRFQLIQRSLKHVLTHRIIFADFYLLETEKRPVMPPDYVWIEGTSLDNYAKPRLFERFLAML